MLTNVLNLNDSNDGNRIKQGDLSIMRYILTDTNKDDLNLDGLPAKVFLTDETGVKYIYDTTVRQYDNAYVCDVVINQIIPANIYTLEIWVDNTYCFPSDNKAKIRVESSVLGNGITKVDNNNLWKELTEYAVKNGYLKSEITETSNIEIGSTEPTDKTKIWIDTGVNK
ncbi:hypothetical protein [Staphylococcus capitis]|uniref:hypothetical protein n=1 Tax=Staphylococcus capitis TaxID=29388 RepID=UPI000BFB75DE|nr:hypothetical protein [Staphylococcus capitis]ATN02491.1 hypothetical protein CRN29_04625 [Staphylococcus capitis]